nr:GYD domain-containing protein [uncultured Steroidobacter sp.]
MATYISLLRYTQQGIEKIKDSPSRLDDARKAFEQLGVNLKAFYLVTGQYDAIVIAEAADAATIAKASLALAARGNVRGETLCAFTEEEFRNIVGALS